MDALLVTSKICVSMETFPKVKPDKTRCHQQTVTTDLCPSRHKRVAASACDNPSSSLRCISIVAKCQPTLTSIKIKTRAHAIPLVFALLSSPCTHSRHRWTMPALHRYGKFKNVFRIGGSKWHGNACKAGHCVARHWMVVRRLDGMRRSWRDIQTGKETKLSNWWSVTVWNCQSLNSSRVVDINPIPLQYNGRDEQRHVCFFSVNYLHC